MRKIVSLLTLLLLTTAVAWSQGKISGTIRDQNGDPVPFATVNVKGTKVSVAADANATFTITAKLVMCWLFLRLECRLLNLLLVIQPLFL
jgi:hypothetical protein